MHDPPLPAVNDRIQAYKDTVFANPDVEIVSFQLMGKTLAEGVSVAEDLLQANPNLHGFLCMNDFAFLGACTALQNAGKVGKVAIGSVDAAPDLVELLAKGLAPKCATAAQLPAEIDKGAVQAHLDHREGETLPNSICLKVELLSPRTMPKVFTGRISKHGESSCMGSPHQFPLRHHKTFPGTVALDGVDLSLNAREVHGLIGEDGAGKSTLMNIINGS